MLEKLLTHLVAAQLTQGTMSGIQEPDPMKRQVLACQVQVNWYEWIKNTLTDPAWPVPNMDSSWLSKAIMTALMGPSGLSGSPPGQPGPAGAPAGPAPMMPPGPIPTGVAPGMPSGAQGVAPTTPRAPRGQDPNFHLRMLMANVKPA